MKHNTKQFILPFKVLLIVMIVLFSFTGLFGCDEESPASTISSKDEPRNISSELSDESRKPHLLPKVHLPTKQIVSPKHAAQKSVSKKTLLKMSENTLLP